MSNRERTKVDIKFARMCLKDKLQINIVEYQECERGSPDYPDQWVLSGRTSKKAESRNWIATLSKITTDKDGAGTVYLNLDKNIKIRSTDISPNFPIYEKFAEDGIEEGKKIIFSGDFVVHDETLSTGYFLSTIALTERGALVDPEFEVELNSISPVN